MCLAQGPQRSDAGEAQTRSLSVSSQASTTEPLRFQQCGILTSVDSDEPVQPPFKLRNSKLCSVSSLIVKEYLSNWQRL